MVTLEMWRTAWRNILADRRSGVISHHQFLKEEEYMRHARLEIERAAVSKAA